MYRIVIDTNVIIAALLSKHGASSWLENYLATRASRGNRDDFLSILDKAGDVEPDKADRI